MSRRILGMGAALVVFAAAILVGVASARPTEPQATSVATLSQNDTVAPPLGSGPFFPKGVQLSYEERGFTRLDDASAALADLGLELSAPGSIDGAEMTDAYSMDWDESGEADALVFEYSNGVVISIEDMGDTSAAAEVVDGTFESEFASVMHRVNIGVHPGVAWTKTEVPGAYNAKGEAEPGTGIELPKSQVLFASGSWLVYVVHEDMPYGQLQRIALSTVQ